MNNIVIVDSRCAGYQGEPIRVIAVTMADSGEILVEKQANWHEPVVKNDNVVVVTDTPNQFNNWSLCFRERENIRALLDAFFDVSRSGLLQISDDMRMYDPRDVLQSKKMSETGQDYEFDTNVSNGHMAVLMAIWGARLAYGGFMLTHDVVSDDDSDSDFMPFSV